MFPPDEFAKMKELHVLYRCALKNIGTRMDTLLEDFENLKEHNPIEHIKLRLKTFESIADKLHRLNFPVTADAARHKLTDVAGLRCICSYTRDIFHIAEVLKSQPDMKVISEKNYVTLPKPSGYRSFHLILEVPIYLTDNIEHVPVEIQIRIAGTPGQLQI
jgi:putative GTP pyrophosphokinase